MEKTIRILFIGNSHTYYNDLPERVACRIRADGIPCEVTMLAHPGWFLRQHVSDPEAKFNILYGHYDYVVLQEHSHPFPAAEEYLGAVRTLNGLIRSSGAKTMIYATWAKEAEPELQAGMNDLHETAAKETGALLAPVGQGWRQQQEKAPERSLYWEDHAHASPAGSDFAADVISAVLLDDLRKAGARA